jgi:hypothetical protein
LSKKKEYGFAFRTLHSNTNSLTHAINKQTHKHKNTKQLILQHLFSFYDSNISINYLSAYNFNPINSLLNIKTFGGLISPTPALKKLGKYHQELNKKTQRPELSFVNFNMLARREPFYTTTNFYPLFYFFQNCSQMRKAMGVFINRLYGKHMQSSTLNNYKTFYNYFMLNFLEKFLQKKI